MIGVHAGWLLKAAEGLGAAHRRYFVLAADNVAHYFESNAEDDAQRAQGQFLPGKGVELGTVDFNAAYFAEALPAVKDDALKQFGLAVHTEARKWLFYADDEAARATWLSVIAQSSKLALGTVPVRFEGPLQKQGGIVVQDWKQRWVLVCDQAIHYFADAADAARWKAVPGSKTLGSFDVRGPGSAAAVKRVHAPDGLKHRFSILATTGREYSFSAPNAAALDTWEFHVTAAIRGEPVPANQATAAALVAQKRATAAQETRALGLGSPTDIVHASWMVPLLFSLTRVSLVSFACVSLRVLAPQMKSGGGLGASYRRYFVLTADKICRYFETNTPNEPNVAQDSAGEYLPGKFELGSIDLASAYYCEEGPSAPVGTSSHFEFFVHTETRKWKFIAVHMPPVFVVRVGWCRLQHKSNGGHPYVRVSSVRMAFSG